MLVYVLTCKNGDNEQTPEGVFYSFESLTSYLERNFNFVSEKIFLAEHYGYFKETLTVQEGKENMRVGWYVCKMVEE